MPPILIPLNVVNGKNEARGVKGLDRLSFSNVGFSYINRYWAHLVVAILAVALVCYILRRKVWEYSKIQSASYLGLPGLSLLITSSL